MTPDELSVLLERLIDDWESEVVEFKEGGAGYSSDKIGRYFSALSNEANLRGADAGWLIFGVRDKTRAVVGSAFRPESEHLQSLKQQIADSADPQMTFRNIQVLDHPDGRVILFEVPPAPRGIPIAWNGHYYARNGESLASLSLDKLDAIRAQSRSTDWSAGILPDAALDDLDPDALRAARAAFAARHARRLTPDQVVGWSVADFLLRAKLTVDGQLTRAAILLLGRPEAARYLSPLLAEITWSLRGEEQAYEHFGPPFLLATTRVYERIRNVQVRMLPPGTLIQTEIAKYDRDSVLEGIHNCVAHSDYASGARIVLTEYVNRIVLENDGSFIDGQPDDYVLDARTPRRYRNPFLVAAMTELNMIDRLGYGIRRMAQSQRDRYLPLPQYDLADPGAVRLTIYGAVIDKNYSELLMARSDLALVDVLALDRVQKGLPISEDAVRRLRRGKLVEGRRPHLHVSAVVAEATHTKADYIRTRALDDEHYTKLVVDYLAKFGQATRRELDDFLLDKLSDALDAKQKRVKISNLLAKMKRSGLIENAGSRTKPSWRRVE